MSEDTCKFGHTFMVDGGDKIHGKIKSGEITSLDEVEEELGNDFLKPLMGEPQKHIKVSGGSSGKAYGAILGAADKFNTDLDYGVEKSEERIFVSPQNQMHQSFIQRKREAENNVKETMQSYEHLMKQKHMLEHDIRKLRSRAEAFDSKDETLLKADFVELVDGRGGGTQQGAEEMPLKSFRDNNIYPTIVADFNEMESMDDLVPEDDGGTGKLADLPRNEKAILRKKWAMYQKWKDMYGSEVQRKLREIKGQLKRVEKSIEETKKWLQPYIQDIVQIHEKDEDHYADEMNSYVIWKGYASMERNLEFIGHKGLVKKGGDIVVAEDEDPTHYRIVYIHGIHVNLAGGAQPQDPSQGPSTAVIFVHRAIVCKHVFENIFQKKINKKEERFEELMESYTGDFSSSDGEKLKEARKEEEISVRELREKIEEKVDGNVPLEVSSQIRRVEDGFDPVEVLNQDYVEAIDEILGTEFADSSDSGGPDEEMYSGFEKRLRKFTGQTDKYYLGDLKGQAMDDLWADIKYNFYIDYKLGQGLFTMK
ncbi:MAG: hypothetical protein ABEJ69_01185 [Candidatus Nanohaloarchaea archaeon]